MEEVIRVTLSRRALRDIEEISEYSFGRWGKNTAEKYLDALEDGLNRLKKDPLLLRAKPEISPYFQFYRVREHFLVCFQAEANIYVLAVKHSSMDLQNRIAELEPTLLREAELLHKTFLTEL
jgi:plasmid stabilization system protein ParE